MHLIFCKLLDGKLSLKLLLQLLFVFLDVALDLHEHSISDEFTRQFLGLKVFQKSCTLCKISFLLFLLLFTDPFDQAVVALALHEA
jgi:hypothetical protein